MNAIDLIVGLVLLLAIWSGWRKGFIRQVFSLTGLIAAIWLASRYGTQAGKLLHLDASIATPGGFVIILLCVILLVSILGILVRKLSQFAGFGLPDTLLGIAVSLLKSALLLSVLFTAFDSFNKKYNFVEQRTLSASRSYNPIMHLSDSFMPMLEWVGDRVPQIGEKPQTSEKPQIGVEPKTE